MATPANVAAFVLGFDRLATQSELTDDRAVALNVDAREVIEHAAALTHEHQQASTAVVVLLVDLEMLGEVDDAVGHQRNLDLGRTSVAFGPSVFCDRVALRGQICSHGGALSTLGYRTRPTIPFAIPTRTLSLWACQLGGAPCFAAGDRRMPDLERLLAQDPIHALGAVSLAPTRVPPPAGALEGPLDLSDV